MRKTRGFTLVELLVVIGVIAILIALLLPALARAREQAQTLVCASNMRQIGIGMDLYAHDWKQWYPPTPWDTTWGPDPGVGQTSWIIRIAPYVSRWDAMSSPSPAKLHAIEVLWCPTAERVTTDYFRHYGINPYIPSFNPNHHYKSRKSNVRRASEMILVAEQNYNGEGVSATGTSGQVGAIYSNYTRVEIGGVMRNNNYRVSHNMRGRRAIGNYLFCDGHVESIPGDLSTFSDVTNLKRYWQWWQ